MRELMRSVIENRTGETGGGAAVVKAAHYHPSYKSDWNRLFKFAGLSGFFIILAKHYGQNGEQHSNANILLLLIDALFATTSNAVSALSDAFEFGGVENGPEIFGWYVALVWLAGSWIARKSVILSILGHLTHRERVVLSVTDEYVRIHGNLLRRSRFIQRNSVERVHLMPNHKEGYDVAFQSGSDLERLASIFGDQTKPLQFKLKLEEALRESIPSQAHKLLMGFAGKQPKIVN